MKDVWVKLKQLLGHTVQGDPSNLVSQLHLEEKQEDRHIRPNVEEMKKFQRPSPLSNYLGGIEKGPHSSAQAEHIGKWSRGEWDPRPQIDIYTWKRKAGCPTLPSRMGSHHCHKPKRPTCRSPQDSLVSLDTEEQWHLPLRSKRTFILERRHSPIHS